MGASVRRRVREFVQAKLIESQHAETAERKARLKRIVGAGGSIPNDLHRDALGLLKAATYDDPENTNPLDDEYADLGAYDPKVAITTSRDPSHASKRFARELSQVIPYADRLNRGSVDVKDLVALCRAHEITDLLVVNGAHTCDCLILCHLPVGPTIYFAVRDVRLRRDVKKKENTVPQSGAFPHLVFEGLTTRVGQRVQRALQALFPIPRPESTRIVSFVVKDDWISFRQTQFHKSQGDVNFAEVGPRFELRLYKIVLGTIEMKAAETEYILRSFLHTKRPVLTAPEDLPQQARKPRTETAMEQESDDGEE